MFYFNPQEQRVLVFSVFFLFSGMLLDICFTKYPNWFAQIDFTSSDQIYPKIDLNQADYQELLNIPYIGKMTAHEIIKYRQDIGLFDSINELLKIDKIKKHHFEYFKNYLKVTVE